MHPFAFVRSQFSKTWTTTHDDFGIQLVGVEVMIRSGLPRFDLIGLPKGMVREGRDRILASLSQLGAELPARKILVNLVPGDIEKTGSHFDLAILAAILNALGIRIPKAEKEFFWGELALDGSIQKLERLSSHILYCGQEGGSYLYTPNSPDPEILPWIQSPLFEVNSLESLLEPCEIDKPTPQRKMERIETQTKNWNSLRGHPDQFLFWVIARLTRQNVLLEGNPGIGKTRWCQAYRDLLSPLQRNEALERLNLIHPNQRLELKQITDRPFESPHHSSSRSSIVGGGSARLQQGAISKAHLGCLYLDELPQFSKDVLESLREPLEDGKITIARSQGTQVFPAKIQLLASMNPCPCGNFQSKGVCSCSPQSLYSYRARVSEALRSRFGLQAWWNFADYEIPKEFQTSELLPRIEKIELQKPLPLKKSLDLQEDNPRRLRQLIEQLEAWCRWRGAQELSESELKNYLNFREQFTKEIYEENQRR